MKKLAYLLLIAVIFTACESNVEEPNQDNLVLLKGKFAGPNSVFSLDFSDPSDAADNTAGMAGWVDDRFAPEEFESVVFDGDDRLKINIDESGPTPPSWYRFQGKKYQNADGTYWDAESNARLSYKFYIDPSWESDGVPQQTGVWLVMGNEDGSIVSYPILEYQDSEANENGEAGFRIFTYELDDNGAYVGFGWEYLGIPKNLKIDPDNGGWVTVETQFHKTENGSALKFRINNKLVADERDYNYIWNGYLFSSTKLFECIINSVNFGVDQDYYYDDIILTKPGFAGN